MSNRDAIEQSGVRRILPFMEHLFFARFQRRDDAERLLRQLDGDGSGKDLVVDVTNSRDLTSSHDMPAGLSNVRAAVWKGILFGGVGGLLFGAALGAAGLGPSVGVTAAFAAMAGALAGTLGSILIGAQDPNERLEKLTKKMGPGEVVLSFHTTDLTQEERLTDRVKAAGGEVVPAAGRQLAESSPRP